MSSPGRLPAQISDLRAHPQSFDLHIRALNENQIERGKSNEPLSVQPLLLLGQPHLPATHELIACNITIDTS